MNIYIILVRFTVLPEHCLPVVKVCYIEFMSAMLTRVQTYVSNKDMRPQVGGLSKHHSYVVGNYVNEILEKKNKLLKCRVHNKKEELEDLK